jgi:hypothetical protein
MTFREFADIYKERHAVAKKLSLARTIDWRIRPILERFGDWALTDIMTQTSRISSPISANRASSPSVPRSGVSRQRRSTARSSCSDTC